VGRQGPRPRRRRRPRTGQPRSGGAMVGPSPPRNPDRPRCVAGRAEPGRPTAAFAATITAAMTTMAAAYVPWRSKIIRTRVHRHAAGRPGRGEGYGSQAGDRRRSTAWIMGPRLVHHRPRTPAAPARPGRLTAPTWGQTSPAAPRRAAWRTATRAPPAAPTSSGHSTMISASAARTAGHSTDRSCRRADAHALARTLCCLTRPARPRRAARARSVDCAAASRPRRYGPSVRPRLRCTGAVR